MALLAAKHGGEATMTGKAACGGRWIEPVSENRRKRETQGVRERVGGWAGGQGEIGPTGVLGTEEGAGRLEDTLGGRWQRQVARLLRQRLRNQVSEAVPAVWGRSKSAAEGARARGRERVVGTRERERDVGGDRQWGRGEGEAPCRSVRG